MDMSTQTCEMDIGTISKFRMNISQVWVEGGWEEKN